MAGKRREASCSRKTTETSVDVAVCLDGPAGAKCATGVGFFDHMLELLGYHSGLKLDVKAEADLHVDAHHCVEDVGIVLGKALREALGERSGFRRFGWARVPMQDALAVVSLDICGRPHMVFASAEPLPEKVGDFDTELTAEFLQALCNSLGMTLHVDVVRGKNGHHVIEAVFKSLALALRTALEETTGEEGVPSTKGVL